MLKKDIINIDGEQIEIYNMRSTTISMDDFVDDDGIMYYPEGIYYIDGYIMIDDEYYSVSYKFDIATGEWCGESIAAQETSLVEILRDSQ